MNLGLSLMRLGYTEALAGRFEQAHDHVHESIAVFEELGATTWTPIARRYLGLLALLRGHVGEAEALLRASLHEGRDHAPLFDLPRWIEGLAAVAASRDDAARAATLWGAADALFERLELGVLEEDRQVRGLWRHEIDGALDRASLTEGWARGHAMTLEQAVAYALTEEAVTR